MNHYQSNGSWHGLMIGGVGNYYLEFNFHFKFSANTRGLLSICIEVKIQDDRLASRAGCWLILAGVLFQNVAFYLLIYWNLCIFIYYFF